MKPFLILLHHYWVTYQTAWQNRHLWQSASRQRDELAFLPPVLELLETPPSPIWRISAWAICLMVVLFLGWGWLGKVDVVATATGKVIPSGHSKTVQTLEAGTVRAIYIREGQYVKQGDVLVELDSTISTADKQKTEKAIYHTQLSMARHEALLFASAQRTIPKLVLPHSLESRVEHDDMANEQRLLANQWQEFQTKLATLEADILRKRAEYEASRDQVSKLSQLLPIISQRASDYLQLMQEGFVSKHLYLEKEQQRIETLHDLASQRHRLKELQAAIQLNTQQHLSQVAVFNKELSDRINEAQKQLTQLKEEYVKAAQQHKATRLAAPVDGIVQGLSIHTLGGVVTPAQTLMHIVPNNETLEAEVLLSNKDVGFVKQGQAVAIKIETFPYTRYGVIDGKVRHISGDAIQNEQRGLVYTAHIQLSRSYVWVEDKKIRLSPGMAVEVDIKTGVRRLIDYFLSPFLEYARESLHER